MKRTIAILLAVMVLTGALTACNGSVGMDDRGVYGNVSTTPDGRVNGRNNQYGAGSQNGSYGSQNGGYGNQNGSYNGQNGSYGAGSSGTGMTGGQ